MNYIIKILYISTIILLFLPAFTFPLFERSFRIYFLTLLPLFALFITLNFHAFTNRIIFLYKNTVFKYLIYFLLYLLVSSFVLLIFKEVDGMRSILYFLQLAILYILPSYLLSAYFISDEVKLKKYLKFYFIILFCIFVFGLVEFIFGKVLHIEFINIIQRFLANERNLDIINESYNNRLCSVFAEPGWLGGFIFLNFPVIYSCCRSKYRIFKNIVLNLTIKKSLIILAWLNIICSMSPIWLIFCILQAFFIFRVKIIKILSNIRIWTILLISMIFGGILGVLVYTTLKIEISQLRRIINSVINLLNFENFVIVEPSLGSRIVSYITQFKIFLGHFLIGVGISNSKYYAADIITKYNIPLTGENFAHYKNSFKYGFMHLNTSVLYTLLSETGLLGTLSYFYLIYKKIKSTKIIINNLPNSLIKDFAKGYHLSVFLYIFMTLYDTFITVPYNWFFLGLAVSLQICYIKIINKQKDKYSDNI